MNPSISVPVLGLAARSGTGKTTLLTRLIPALSRRGLRCAVIKHSHHDFDVDVPGKDSYRLRTAGAAQVLLASPHRTFWVEEGDGRSEPALGGLLRRLDPDALDLVLVEGFRDAAIAKIEVHRPSCGRPLLCADDPHIVAVACDAPPREPVDLPLLPLNDPDAVAAFVCGWLQVESAAR